MKRKFSEDGDESLHVKKFVKLEIFDSELFKYHRFLPTTFHQPILEHRNILKNIIINHPFLTSKEVTDDEVYEFNRLFRRYIKLEFTFNRKEKAQLANKIIEIVTTNKNLDFMQQTHLFIFVSSFLLQQSRRKVLLEGIVVQWRTLYDSFEKQYFTKYRKIIYTPDDKIHLQALVKFVKETKRYFPKEATNEILSTIRPYLCIHDHYIFKAVAYLSLFLPTTRNNSNHGCWKDELLELWGQIGCFTLWDLSFFRLFGDLARDCIGDVQWKSEDLDQIFHRCLKCFEVPVDEDIYIEQFTEDYYYDPLCLSFFSKLNYDSSMSTNSLIMRYSAKLIVWLINSCQADVIGRISVLIDSIRNYFLPFNEQKDEWMGPLQDFLFFFSEEVSRRVDVEQHCSNENMVPQRNRLSDEVITKIVMLMYPMASNLIMNTEKGERVAMGNHVLKNLAQLKPLLIFPLIGERLTKMYHHVLGPNLHMNCLFALENLVYIFVRRIHLKDVSKIEYDGTIINIQTLFNSVVRCIDSNDKKKTEHSLLIFMTLVTSAPLRLLVPSISFLQTWMSNFISNLCRLIENQTPTVNFGIEGSANNIGSSGTTETTIAAFSQLIIPLFSQIPDDIAIEQLKKMKEFVQYNFLYKSRKNVGELISYMAFGKPKITLEIFVPFLFGKLFENGSLVLQQESKDDEIELKLREGLNGTELEWFFFLLGKVFARVSGGDVRIYEKSVLACIRLCLRFCKQGANKNETKSMGKFLKSVLTSILSITSTEINPENYNGGLNMGKFERVHKKNLDITWKLPTIDDNEFAAKIIKITLPVIVESMEKSTEKVEDFVEIYKWISLFGYFIRGASCIWGRYLTGAGRIFVGSYKCTSSKEIQEIFSMEKTVEVLVKITQKVVRKQGKEVNPAIPKILIKTFDNVFCVRHGMSDRQRSNVEKAYAIMRTMSNMRNYDDIGDKFPRLCYLYRTGLIKHSQTVERIEDDIQELFSHNSNLRDQMFDVLLHLSMCPFEKIRIRAQGVICRVLKLYRNLKFNAYVVSKSLNVLRDKKSNEKQLTGSIYLLKKVFLANCVLSNFDLFAEVVLTLCLETSHITRENLDQKVNELNKVYLSNYYQSKCDPQKYIELVTLLGKSLVESKIHWRYKEMILSWLHLLVRCKEGDILFPVEVSEIIFSQIVSEIEGVRTTAIETMNLIMCQYKPIQPKMRVPGEKEKFFGFFDEDNSKEKKSKIEDRLFIEKNHVGWYIVPDVVETYDYSKNVGGPNETIQEHRELFLKKVMKKLYSGKKATPFFQSFLNQCVERANNNDYFDESLAQFWKGLCQIVRTCEPFANSLFDLAKSLNEENIDDGTKLNKCITVFEFLGGVVRGIKHWKENSKRKVWEKVIIPQFEIILSPRGITSDIVGEMSECLDFMVCDKDLRRYQLLTNFFFEKFRTKLLKSDGNSLEIGRFSQFLFSIVQEISWRDSSLMEKVLVLIVQGVDHPSKQCREILSVMAAVICKNMWMPKSFFKDDDIVRMNKHLIDRKSVCEKFSLHLEDRIMKVEEMPKEKLEEKREKMKIIGDFFIGFVTNLYVNSSPHCLMDKTETILMLLVILQRNLPQDDKEIQKEVEHLFYLIGNYTFPREITLQVFNFILENSHKIVNSKCRKYFIKFFLVFFYFNRVFLGKECQETAIKFMRRMLKDKVVEVRKEAAISFARLLRVVDFMKVRMLAKETTHTMKVLNQGIRKKKKRKKKKLVRQRRSKSATDSDLISLVFCGCAIINSIPCEIPSFFPKLMIQLAKRAHHNMQEIRDLIKFTFEEFWKSRKDRQEVKKKFDSEDDFNEIIMATSPSYFM